MRDSSVIPSERSESRDLYFEGVASRGAGIKNEGPERMRRIGRMQEQLQRPLHFGAPPHRVSRGAPSKTISPGVSNLRWVGGRLLSLP